MPFPYTGIDDAVQEKRREREDQSILEILSSRGSKFNTMRGDQSIEEIHFIVAREQIQHNTFPRRQSVGEGSTDSTKSTPRKRQIRNDKTTFVRC